METPKRTKLQTLLQRVELRLSPSKGLLGRLEVHF